MNHEEKVKFWLKETERALAVSDELFKLKRYLESLFFGHLALERMLKAKIIEISKKEPVYSHDLLILAKDAKIQLEQKQIDFLAKVNVYNIRTRYQDYKLSLYKQATKSFTEKELKEINKFFKEIYEKNLN